MPDEAIEAPAVDTEDTPTPDAEAPIGDTPAAEETPEETNWQERYEHAQKRVDDLLSNTTQAQQEAAQYRRVVELARQGDPEALEYLGYEAPEQDEPEATEDEKLRQEIAELKEWRDQQAREAEEQEYFTELNNYRNDELERLDKVAGRKFSEREVKFLVALADANPKEGEDGNVYPDFDLAFEELSAFTKEERKALVNSKRAPKPPSGAPGEPTIDTSTPEGRRKAIEDIAAEAIASE